MAIIKLHQNRINPLVLPVILAKELGLFEKHQVAVDLSLADDFIFGGKSAFMEGKVDAMMGDTSFFFYYLDEGKYAKITSNLTRTIQLVDDGKLDDNEDVIVGVNRTGLFRFFQKEFMEGRLKDAKVEWLNNTYDRIEAMSQGKVNSLVAIEPFISKVQKEFGSRVLWHSNQIPNYFVMWCFDGKFVDENPQDVINFHAALEEAAMWFNNLTADEKEQACLTYGKHSSDLAKSFREFEFEPQGNYTEEDFDLLQKWMLEEKEIHNAYQASDCIFNSIK